MSRTVPDIDVVIPLYNGGDTIGRLLDALLAQTRPPRRIVVVDDHSTDDGPERVSRFPHTRLLTNPEKGANPARVFGLSQVDAPYVALFDQDDVPHPDHFDLLAGLLDTHPDCPAVLGRSIDMASDTPAWHGPPNLSPEPFDPWELFPVYPSESPSAAVIRRAELDRSGGWCTRFVGVADTYAWLRLSEHKPLLRNESVSWARGVGRASYSWTLRTQKAAAYFHSRHAASADAMAHRLALRPSDETKLRPRLAVFSALAEVMNGLNEGQSSKLSRGAIELEETTRPHGEAFFDRTCRTMMWFLWPTLTHGERGDRERLLEALVERWPAEAPTIGHRIYRGVADYMPARHLLAFLRSRSTGVVRWRLVGSMLLSRVRRKLGHEPPRPI